MAFQQFSRKTCWKTCFFLGFGVGKHAGTKNPGFILHSFLEKLEEILCSATAFLMEKRGTVLTHKISQAVSRTTSLHHFVKT